MNRRGEAHEHVRSLDHVGQGPGLPLGIGLLRQFGLMAGQSGGHYCDPLIAFMMVYNAIKGNYTDFEGKFEDVNFPYLYVSSPDDYKNYEKYFVDQLPFTPEEMVAMSKLSMEDLKALAASISVEDAAARANAAK